MRTIKKKENKRREIKWVVSVGQEQTLQQKEVT